MLQSHSPRFTMYLLLFLLYYLFHTIHRYHRRPPPLTLELSHPLPHPRWLLPISDLARHSPPGGGDRWGPAPTRGPALEANWWELVAAGDLARVECCAPRGPGLFFGYFDRVSAGIGIRGFPGQWRVPFQARVALCVCVCELLSARDIPHARRSNQYRPGTTHPSALGNGTRIVCFYFVLPFHAPSNNPRSVEYLFGDQLRRLRIGIDLE